MAFHDFIRDSEGWQTRQDETLFANPYLSVHRVTSTSPSAVPPPYSPVERPTPRKLNRSTAVPRSCSAFATR